MRRRILRDPFLLSHHLGFYGFFTYLWCVKKEIIKTQDYLLVVDDSEIKQGDYGFITSAVMFYDAMLKEWNQPLGSKIIAHLPLNDSPILEGVPLLPPLEDDDSNKDLFYQKQVMNPYPTGGQSYTSYEKGFIDGYNKAKEKYKFTEEDMINFACKVYNENYHKDDSFFTTAETLIKSFSQPKTPTHFEFEMEDGFSKNNDEYIDELGAKGNYYTHLKVIKTITNSQGQTVTCGKYIY